MAVDTRSMMWAKRLSGMAAASARDASRVCILSWLKEDTNIGDTSGTPRIDDSISRGTQDQVVRVGNQRCAFLFQRLNNNSADLDDDRRRTRTE